MRRLGQVVQSAEAIARPAGVSIYGDPFPAQKTARTHWWWTTYYNDVVAPPPVPTQNDLSTKTPDAVVSDLVNQQMRDQQALNASLVRDSFAGDFAGDALKAGEALGEVTKWLFIGGVVVLGLLIVTRR